MSLEGNLSSFGLSEILQLIAIQQKSGMLAISSQDRSMMLFFRDGSIMSTRDRRRKTKDPLRDYLIRYGILSREELIRLTQMSTQSKLDITDIIVSEGFLDDEQMMRHCRNQIQEAIHEILIWEQCSYKFIPGLDIITGIKSMGEYGIEGMLMESMRRIDEFPQMEKEFPDVGAKISRLVDPEDDMELTSNELAVLKLLGEDRTVSYLISHAKMPKFETYEALKHLREKKLIKAESDKKAEPEELAKDSKRKRGIRRSRNIFPMAAALALFLSAVIIGARNFSLHVRPQLLNRDVTTGSSIERNRAEDHLKWLLEAYRAQNGYYPSSLSRLEDGGLADKAFLLKVQRMSFRYHLTAGRNRYTLL
jgi:hypothetical protein